MALPPCKYRTGRTLGSGTYAIVKEVFHIETGQKFAAKVINKNLMRGREHLIKNEIFLLTKVSKGHDNIVNMIDYFETSNNLYLVMELATGGELFDRIFNKGTFIENEAKQVIRTVVDAVAYLHDQGIVHRDLKPENLIYKTSDMESKLLVADFGLAKVIDPDQFYSLTTTCGTPGYMAPEIYMKTGYGKPVDMWAVGVITYFLLSGEPPFHHPDPMQRIQAITTADYNFESPRWAKISENAKHFIQCLLIPAPESRLTAHYALNHCWLTTSQPINGLDHALNLPSDQTLPTNVPMRSNVEVKKSFKNAVNALRAINYLKRIDNYPIDEEVGHSI